MPSLPPPGPERPGSGWAPEPSPSPRRAGERLATPLSDPLIPPDLRGWCERVLAVMRRGLVPLLLIQSVVAAVNAVASYAVVPPVGAPDPSELHRVLALLGMLAAAAVGVVGQGSSLYLAIQDAAGRPLSTDRMFRFAVERAPALVGWAVVACLLIVIGTIPLIVPGVYLAVVLGAALPGVIIIERRGIARCFELVNPRFWPTAARMGVVVLAGVAYLAVARFVVSALTTPGSFREALLGAAAQIPLEMAAVGVAVVTYAELRFHERGTAFTSTLADELDR